jgi:hypothetical protein
MDVVIDRERLVSALRASGLNWLAPGDAHGEPIPDAVLVASLALHEDPRLRAALTGLFILRPELASCLAEILQQLDLPARHELMARYMAAVYLQRFWRTRLGLYLGNFAELPDLYSQLLNLPDADEGFGKIGLHRLANWHQQNEAVIYNRLAEYRQQIDLVFAALKLRIRTHEPTIAG